MKQMLGFLVRWRMAIGGIGVAVGVLGIARDDRRVIWVAIGCLAAALLLRFVGRWLARRARNDPGR